MQELLDSLSAFGPAGLILSALLVLILCAPYAAAFAVGTFLRAAGRVAIGDQVKGACVTGTVVALTPFSVHIQDGDWGPFVIPWTEFLSFRRTAGDGHKP